MISVRCMVLFCVNLFFIAAGSSITLQKKQSIHQQIGLRLQSAVDRIDLLEQYAEPFANSFPPSSKSNNKSLMADDFPLVDWQDRIPVWLSSVDKGQSAYSWGEKLSLSSQNLPGLSLAQYPLNITVTLRHEGKLIDWIEQAWKVNPGGIELRGCQVSRLGIDIGLSVQCLFVMSSFSWHEQKEVIMEEMNGIVVSG